ncbi:helix-turn-helix domain-containing protein, partial [Rhizobium leguminosarum]|uniref:helix-turn-helix domain-containing protein n=1 Tax=Rhizobium leguminosarum TaxID=384 RepID=UPI003F9B01E5
ELIESHGSDGLKMSEIVEKAGLSFGALYQYFPDKTSIIRTLADFNDLHFLEEGDRLGALFRIQRHRITHGGGKQLHR